MGNREKTGSGRPAIFFSLENWNFRTKPSNSRSASDLTPESPERRGRRSEVVPRVCVCKTRRGFPVTKVKRSERSETGFRDFSGSPSRADRGRPRGFRKNEFTRKFRRKKILRPAKIISLPRGRDVGVGPEDADRRRRSGPTGGDYRAGNSKGTPLRENRRKSVAARPLPRARGPPAAAGRRAPRFPTVRPTRRIPVVQPSLSRAARAGRNPERAFPCRKTHGKKTPSPGIEPTPGKAHFPGY